MAERRSDQVRHSQRSAHPSYKEFGSSALHVEFERHVKAAQDAFLKGDNAAAEREATLALRFRPTPHLFALLAVVAESKGQYDRASDFRLLQAFLAKDTVLWEELLHEFLSQQLYYKSVVCLQRLSALEKSDATRYRTLQLQLADLLVGLGEIRRATNVLVPLWNRSKCRDFEVFAQLASLYFQLGKWNSLEGLIASSLKYAFHVDTDGNEAGADAASEANATKREGVSRSTRRSGTKRVRFEDDEDNDDLAKREEPGIKEEEHEGTPTGVGSSLWDTARTADELVVAPSDDFGFDELMPNPGETTVSTAPAAASGPTRLGVLSGHQADRAAQSIRKHYGDRRLVLHTEEEKRNFLTLVNVHAELLNERGKYTETIRLVEMTAGTVGVELLDLPPDLLTRLGTAYAYQGDLEQPCREVFQHLLETCSMDEYGDVLLDAATTLQKVGMHRDALQLFETITRYHEFRLQRLREEKDSLQSSLPPEDPDRTDSTDAVGPSPSLSSLLKRARTTTTASPELLSLRAELADLRAEESELITVVATGLYGQARCHYALRDHAKSEELVRKALTYEPTHLQARLLLGRLRFYDAKDVDGAVAALTPMANEPGLHRLQLGAALVGIFKRANKLIEAIALGVSVFELILSSSEDGDTDSVAPGSSVGQRRTVKLHMPSLSRASSAIIPASSLSAMLHGPSGGTTASRRLSSSIAASVKASSTVFTQQLRRRGMSALTTTVYGASAAASVAAGWEREQEEARLRDSSTIFRFVHRRRRRGEANDGQRVNADNEGEVTAPAADDDGDVDTAHRRRQRAETIAHMPAKAFWDSTEDKEAGGSEENAKTAESEVAVKADGETVNEAKTVTAAAADQLPASSSCSRKRRRIEGGGADGVDTLPDTANMTTTEARDDDLAELEAFVNEEAVTGVPGRFRQESSDTHAPSGPDSAPLREHEEAVEPTENDDEPPLESYELPSLDEISEQFDDPTLSKLFLDATANFSLHKDAEGGGASSDPWAIAHQGSGEAGGAVTTDAVLPGGFSPELHKVTMREAVEALGRTELITLATTVVECYSLLGHFSEAKEFAYMTLVKLANRSNFRTSGEGIERPLRIALLRSALAAREAEDAFRVGLNLLLQDSTDDEKTTIVELLHRVLNLCGPAASGGTLLHAVLEGQNDVPLVVLLANRYYMAGSYLHALNLYLVALNKRPEDALLNWMSGLLFVLVSHQRRVRSREACVSAGMYYLQRYETLVTAVSPSRTGEAVYNMARVFQYLRLYHLCVPLYQRVATDLPVPERCSVALRRAAQFNLYHVLRWHSGNLTLALSMLPLVEAHMTSTDQPPSPPLAGGGSLHSPFA